LVPVLRSDGGGQRLIIQASDVTTWKQERDELQRKSETIQALIQAGRSATADTDIDSVDEFVLYAVKITGAESGGAGLNLSGVCSYVRYYDYKSEQRHDYPWPAGSDLEAWLQAKNRRIYRICRATTL
jgi:hypothetical protein